MKKILFNTILFFISFFLTYGMVEFAFRIALPYLPQALFNNQCRELRTLGQTSKQGVVPKTPYIAILGDSYGAGQGDWFIENRYNPNSRYQAAHVIQDITNQDVISLSRAGAGNYDGAAIYAINTWRYLNNTGFNISPPDTIIVYFYEGNDLDDNLRFMKDHYAQQYSQDTLFEDAVFEKFADKMDIKYTQGDLPRLQDKFLVGNLASRYVEGMIYSATQKKQPLTPGTKYPAILNDKKINMPDSLENDLTRYTPEQVRQGVRFYERSLNQVIKTWDRSKRYALYIPSPLTTYNFIDSNAENRLKASIRLENEVRRASEAHGFTFIEFSPAMRKAAHTQLLHGPLDWAHLNKTGYQLLGSTIAHALKQ